MKYKLVLLIPVLDEKDNIDRIINFIKIKKDFLLIFIVTCYSSDDETLRLVKIANEKYSNVKYVQNSIRGLGFSYVQGFEFVKKNYDYLFVCTMDADGSHSFDYLGKLIAKTKFADIVIGSRYVENTNSDWNFLRKTGSRFINWVFNKFTILNIFDCTSGYKIYSKKAVDMINFKEIVSEGFVFQVEMLCRAIDAELKLKEVSYVFKSRGMGKSKMRIKDILEYFNILLLYISKSKPQ